jgi:hypothetical protein
MKAVANETCTAENCYRSSGARKYPNLIQPYRPDSFQLWSTGLLPSDRKSLVSSHGGFARKRSKCIMCLSKSLRVFENGGGGRIGFWRRLAWPSFSLSILQGLRYGQGWWGTRGPLDSSSTPQTVPYISHSTYGLDCHRVTVPLLLATRSSNGFKFAPRGGIFFCAE